MEIILYKTASEPNRLSKVLTSPKTLNGTLRAESSIINPNIVMEIDDIVGYNYMYIPEFERYYFITDIISIRNRLFKVNGHVDVLMTYATSIRNNRAIIDRIADEEQKYLPDSRYTFNSYNNYYVQKFDTSLSKNLSYILVVAGQN